MHLADIISLRSEYTCLANILCQYLEESLAPLNCWCCYVVNMPNNNSVNSYVSPTLATVAQSSAVVSLGAS
jgi:hypothetical protein